MVIVDPYRCAYCGGCVSVCPVGALSLAETRLVVGEGCLDCGCCVAACPLGALRVEGTVPLEPAVGAGCPRHYRRRYDLVVVGAGPGGSTAALEGARAGLSVLLLEKRQEIGTPVRCAEGVGHEQIAPFIEPDPRWIAAEVTQAEITTVAGGATRTLRLGGGRGYILERRVFDRVLAERAARAGAEVRVKSAVTGLLLEAGRVRGVRIRRGEYGRGDPAPTGGRGEVEVEAQVVVAADGVEAQVGRWAGLDLHLPLADTMVCAQYLLAGIDVDPACTCYILDADLAPGGYAWIFPKGEGAANVGLGVQADLAAESALAYLNRFVESRPFLAQGHPVTLIAGNVPVALPPAQLASGGLLLAGDAARQVDPLTSGGIANAMAAGRLAAQVAAEAIAAGDTSAAFLARYQEQWQASVGRKMQRNYRLRERFAPEARADERFVRAFALAVG
jgi:digeranylgeranylglycerophospholipid reductase